MTEAGLLAGSGERAAFLVEEEISGMDMGLFQRGIRQTGALIPDARHTELRGRGGRLAR
jgi:hypothetical protein